MLIKINHKKSGKAAGSGRSSIVFLRSSPEIVVTIQAATSYHSNDEFEYRATTVDIEDILSNLLADDL
jgi:hypothetical protein